MLKSEFDKLKYEMKKDFEDSKEVKLKLGKSNIKGTYDLVVDGAVDDIKSASTLSYTNKFVSFDTVSESDPFGYVGQLAGYAKASGKKVGGWWVINKNNADFKYIPATGIDLSKDITKLKDTAKRLAKN